VNLSNGSRRELNNPIFAYSPLRSQSRSLIFAMPVLKIHTNLKKEAIPPRQKIIEMLSKATLAPEKHLFVMIYPSQDMTFGPTDAPVVLLELGKLLDMPNPEEYFANIGVEFRKFFCPALKLPENRVITTVSEFTLRQSPNVLP